MMSLIPLSGLTLLSLAGEGWELAGGEWQAPIELLDDDLLLAVHITTHLIFLAAVTIHIGPVLKHQLIDRDHLLDRMS